MIHDDLGLWIPSEVWDDTNLTFMEILFYSKVMSLNREGSVRQSNAYFSEYFGFSKGRVSQIVTNLKNKGYIRSEIRKERGEIIGRTIVMLKHKNLPLPGFGDLQEETDEPSIVFPKVFSSLTDNLTIEKKELLLKWINYRQELKKPIKIKSTAKNLVAKFLANSYVDLKTAVDSSVANGWQGLFIKEAKLDNSLEKQAKTYKEL